LLSTTNHVRAVFLCVLLQHIHLLSTISTRISPRPGPRIEFNIPTDINSTDAVDSYGGAAASAPETASSTPITPSSPSPAVTTMGDIAMKAQVKAVNIMRGGLQRMPANASSSNPSPNVWNRGIPTHAHPDAASSHSPTLLTTDGVSTQVRRELTGFLSGGFQYAPANTPSGRQLPNTTTNSSPTHAHGKLIGLLANESQYVPIFDRITRYFKPRDIVRLRRVNRVPAYQLYPTVLKSQWIINTALPKSSRTPLLSGAHWVKLTGWVTGDFASRFFDRRAPGNSLDIL
jgi:hypothetical protein